MGWMWPGSSWRSTRRDASCAPGTLSPEASLRDAAHLLSSHGVSGAPVCDASGRVVGMLSRSDLVDAWFGEHTRSAECIREVMSEDVIAVAPDDDTQTVAERLVFE